MTDGFVVNKLVDPFAEDRLAPEHLALLFPATFYQNDESLALHLTESCLVETTTWDGDSAIGETAFWLKVLSTPQTEYLRQQKRIFKLNVAKAYKQFTNKETKKSLQPLVPALPTVIQMTTPGSTQPRKEPKTPGTVTILVNDQNKDNGEGEDGALKNNEEGDSSPTGFGLNSYKCKLCSYATDTRERLNIHQKNSHAAERPYGCEYCNYTSRYPWNIKTHVDNVHLKTKRFKCEHCDFYSPQACLLKRHVNRVHSGTKNIKCQYCDYRANHKDVLRRHIHMKHTGEFDHKCPYCPYGRDAKYEVEDHINAVHLKKVIYQCSECNFQTYRKITLRSHHKDHENKPLLNCPSCSYKSIYPSATAKHIREEHPNTPMPPELKDARRRIEQKNIIGGDVDYTPILMCKCKLCDFTTERITKLRSHVRRVHAAGTRNCCPVCKAGFANKRNLKNHLAKQHPGINPADLVPPTPAPQPQEAGVVEAGAADGGAAESSVAEGGVAQAGVAEGGVAEVGSVAEGGNVVVEAGGIAVATGGVEDMSAAVMSANSVPVTVDADLSDATAVTIITNVESEQNAAMATVEEPMAIEESNTSEMTANETILFLSDIAKLGGATLPDTSS